MAEFDALCRQWVYADVMEREESPLMRTKKTPRKRRAGAGRKWALDAPTRLLMALVWLKVYPTWEVLAYLFGVDERTARRSTKDVLTLLPGIATFLLEQKARAKRGGELTQEQKGYNRALSKARTVVEHLFGRISYFGAVYQVYRHRRERHSGVVRVVAWLIERCLAAGVACA